MTVAVGLIALIALVASTIYFTRDPGEPEPASTMRRWTLSDSGVSSTLLDIDFVDSRHGWTVGHDGVILATADGGDSWHSQQSGFELTLRSVEFVDPLAGWAVGHLGLILHTPDGGLTWTIQGSDVALGQNLIFVRFEDRNNGWIISERGSFSLRTTDSGVTWKRQFFDSTLLRSDGFILDGDHAWAALQSGRVLSTANSGDTWDSHEGINTVQIGTTGVFFLDQQHGWIAGWRGKQQGLTSGVQFVKYLTDGMVARTTDGGRSWTRVDSDTGRFLWDVVFKDQNRGWAVGSFGHAMSSSDGGLTWTPEPTGTDSTLRALTLSDSATGWAVGDYGTIMKLAVE